MASSDGVRPTPAVRSIVRCPGRTRARVVRAATIAAELGSARRPRACSSGAATATPRGAGLPRRRAARARPVPARRHGASGRDDPRGDRRGQAHLRPRRLRRRRNLRDRAGGAVCCASSAPTSSGTCRSRFEEGYGARAARRSTRLAEEGCGLVLTVDCGITAVDEVAAARRLGLDVVVTDHHRPGDELPDCPVVATRPSDYPFPELCGTGVVYKLAQALLGAGPSVLDRHLDLVALATIADVVPLVDENRALAIAGLRALARPRSPACRR